MLKKIDIDHLYNGKGAEYYKGEKTFEYEFWNGRKIEWNGVIF